MTQAIHHSAMQRHTLRLRPLAFALFGVSLCSFPGMAGAQVVVVSGNTTVYKAPNGVQVVDIATANGAGVSHNVFTEFNVARNGMVLNNGDSSQMARQSELAGQVSANLNLNNSAKLILNEVTGGNRSTLAGHLEVLGGRAEVVIANPYGITCDGCGFINTPRVTLSTGVPTLDAEGRLTGLRVGNGDILVSGSGLNGGGVDYLDLVARSVRLDGQVNAADLSVTAGVNNWDYANRSATADAAGTNAPALGIDSSALGGMYANRIRLLATETGVGVRLLGDAAASAAELAIDANGQITLQGRLSAQTGNIAVSTNGQAGAIAVTGRAAAISAGGDIILATAAPGAGIVLSDATLRAGRDLQVRSAGALVDSAGAGNADALRFAGAAVTVTAAGAATLDGSSWGAGGALDMRAAGLAVGPTGATLYSGADQAAAARGLSVSATNGNLNLGTARLVAPGALALDAGKGVLTLGTGGRLTSAAAMILAAGALENAGEVIAGSSIALRSASLHNSGLLQAETGFTLEAGGAFANTGSVLAGGALDLHAATLDNSGVLQAGTTLAASLDTSLGNSGKLLAQGDLRITSRSTSFAIENRQLIQAGGSLLIGDDAHRARLGNAAGATVAGSLDQLVLESLSNEGIIQGRDALMLRSSGEAVNAVGGLILTRGASGAQLAIDAGGTLRNEGALQSEGSLAASAGGALVNRGTMVTQDGAIALRGASIDNSGTIGAAGRLDLAAGGFLNNAGTAQSSGALTASAGTVMKNGATGKLLALGDLSLFGGANFRLDNYNMIQAGATLAIGGAAGRPDLHNLANASLLGKRASLVLGSLVNGGRVQAEGALTIDAAGTVDINAGAAILSTGGGAIALQAGARIANAGSVESSGALSLSSATALDNLGTIVTLGRGQGGFDGGLTLTADALANSGTIASSGSTGLAARNFVNDGSVYSQGAFDATLGASLINKAGGVLLSDDALHLATGAASFSVTNAGHIQAGARLDIGAAGHLADIDNMKDGVMLGGDTVLEARSFTNDGAIRADGVLQANARGSLANGVDGTMAALGGTLGVSVGGDVVNAGILQAAKGMDLAAVGRLVNSHTVQTLGGDLTLRAAGISNGGKGFVGGAGDVVLDTGSVLDNQGKLIAGGDLRVYGAAPAFKLDNAGRLQAGGLLELGDGANPATLTNKTGAVILGGQASLQLDTLSNAGDLQATTALDVDVRGKVDNLAGASMITAGAGPLALRAGGSVGNTGLVQSGGALSLTAGRDFVNDGNAVGAAATDIAVAGAFRNAGLVQGGGLTVTAAGLTNSGDMLSSAALGLSGAGRTATLTNTGRIQAATALTVCTAQGLVDVDNGNTGFIVGGDLSFSSGSFLNAGLVQGDSLGATAVYDLRNLAAGRLLAVGGAGASLALEAGTLTNDGIVQSNGSLALEAGTIDNNGKLYVVAPVPGAASTGSLAITSVGGPFTNSGEVASDGSVAIRADGTMRNELAAKLTGKGEVGITLENGLANLGSIASGAGMTVGSWRSGFTLDNEGSLQSAGLLRIGSSLGLVGLTNTGKIFGRQVTAIGSNLINQGEYAQLLTTVGGAGLLNLYFDNGIDNEGALHADGRLVLRGGAVHNYASGGISALGDMSLTAARGDLKNEGWLFGMGNMALSAPGHAIQNAAQGNIEGGSGLLSFNTIGSNGNNGSVSNYNSIHTPGNIQVDTGAFLNQAANLPTVKKGELGAPGAYILMGDNEFNCDGGPGTYGNCAHSSLLRYDFIVDQSYSNNDSKVAAQLLAEGDIAINYYQSAVNKFALISGKDVTISAIGNASAFENADLHLMRETYARYVWVRVNDDELHYPTSEAAYNAAPFNPANGSLAEEAPGNWKTYCNEDWSDCRDPWARAGMVAGLSDNYAKLTGSVDLPGQVSYSAGIYAKTAFTLNGAINQNGTVKRLAGDPLAKPGTAPKTGGDIGTLRPVDAETASGRNGLAPLGNGAKPDLAGPGLAGGIGKTGLNALGATAAAQPAGLTPVLVGGVASGMTTVVGANGVAFTGPNLSVPASPNGMFVAAAPNNTSYLVETNPLFLNGSALGSNYLAQRLGFDPAVVQKRLGDANYEARLVREQLVAQTNNFLLSSYGREADQMKGLMDSAAGQSTALGLRFGMALSADQAARLTDDLVWMVETSVNGQKVLAPVVYLSAATRAAVLNGSVIAARDVRIDGDSITNNGGTIVATNTLSVTTKGDITNTGGTIRANTVALTSLGGSVVNQTAATFYGNEAYGRTSIGPTGTITATDKLAIDAARDVRVIGATLAAGGNASIMAGNDVVLDTIQDKRADTTSGRTGNPNNGSSWARQETDVRQIGSTLNTGGNLTITSGKDVTIAGSSVNAGGNVDIDAKRDLNIVDRQDVNQVTELKKTSSSGFTAKGSAVGYAVSDSSETTKTRTGTSVASSITSGGNTSLEAARTATVRGSDVAAGGDLAVNATDVKLLAGQNTFDQTVDRKASSTGVSVGVDIAVVKGAIGLASGGTPSVADVARVVADGVGNQGINVGLNSTTTTTHTQESNSTARVSSLTSGGKTSVTAKEKALFEGTRVVAGGDIAVEAKTLDMLEARNKTSYNVQSETTGLKVSVATDPMNIARKAVAENLYSGGGDGVTLASVENTRRDLKSSTDTSTLASFTSGGSMTRTAGGTLTDQGTQITVAKDFTQKAAAIKQLAATDRTSREESVTTNTGKIGASVDFATTDAFNGLKHGSPGGVIGLASGPTLGGDVKYTRNVSDTSEQGTTARVGSVVAGGNIVSESSAGTRFEGTRFASGGDTRITAATLDAGAAPNTQTSSTKGNTVNAAARVEGGLTGTPSGSLGAGYATTRTDAAASQAAAGTITAGGNLTIATTGNAVFEGTQLAAGKDASIKSSKGAVEMKSADSTASGSASQWGVRGEVSASPSNSKIGASVSVDVANSSSRSSTAQVASVRAGNNLAIEAKKDVTLVGTMIGAGNDAKLDAGGNLNLIAAKDSSASDSTKVGVSLSGARSTKAQSVAAQVGVGLKNASSINETGSDIVAGNKVTLKSGGATTMQGTQIDVGKSVTTEAKGGVVKRDAVATSSSYGLQVDAYAQLAAKRKAPPAPGAAPAAGTAATPADAPATSAAGEAAGKAAGADSGAAPDAAPAPSTWSKVKGAGVAVKDNAGSAVDLKNSTSFPLAWASKNDDSDSSTTAVAIRAGKGADTARLPQVVNLMTLPAVKSAVQVNAALAAPLAQYGSQAAIPDTVKRAILQQAGVPVPPGADVGALLAKTQNAGKNAAIEGLAGSSLNAEQHAAALRAIGLGN